MGDHADKVVADIKPLIQRFHELSKGNIEAIGMLFSVIANELVPPPIIMQLLKLEDEQLKEAQEKKQIPVARLDQLENAIRSSIDTNDTPDKYKKYLQEHIERFEVVEKVMSGLQPTMATFHSKVKGDIAKIELLFVDMAPEPQKGKPMPQGMIQALLRVPPSETTCSQEDFLECFRRNLDATDTVEKLKPVFDAHIAKY